ncbi:unannotated protein [freshwater metagenome]|uniref:Unannotated protein n=1 Tax=freshwater metagenome TaxID=449393 RepID=A0A6J7EG20_9ZZZZ|nr:molybdate ABC transporter substrate-binding protein [Actinomycetota bacterium]
MGKTHRVLVASLAVLGSVASSCGSDAKDTAATTAATSTPAATATAASNTASATTVPTMTGTITVFAASSLTEAFTEMGAAFEKANPGAKVIFSFGGSGDLVTQIGQGAPADVFASADDSNMTKLVEAGNASGTPTVVAKNSLEIITEAGNPKGIATLADLATPDLVVVLCATTAPCGKLAALVLKTAGVTVVPKSLEDKVKGVVTKVTMGEADAGIVFATDVQAAGSKATGVAIPAEQNAVTNYSLVVTKQATNTTTASAFIASVASPAGQAILAKYGFLAP